jgi:manganese transport protein
MSLHSPADVSLQEVNATVETGNKKGKWRRLFAFLGPAYLVSVGYMDPGNWATDLAGGSKYGYSLIWVLLMSNLMALLLQSHSARLGIVRRLDLAQANRQYYPKAVNFALYLLAEIAIAATDLAEVLGMAIGLHLLFGLPIMWGVLITLLDTFLLLFLQRLGIRKMEAFIIGLIAVIGISFLINIVLSSPEWGEVLRGFIPGFPDPGQLYREKNITAPLPSETALYLAVGIIGATVMPHNLYLHSALVQTRKVADDPKSIARALKANFIDSTIALNLAFFVNAAILILAATVFFKSGRTEVASIQDAHQLLAGMLGTEWAPRLFAIALIASGQSSTITGTLAGQIVMEGYLRLRISPWIRRLITRLLAIIPAVIVIYLTGDENLDAMLVLSQVILSLQLGFAIIPLIHFVSDKNTMGPFAIGPRAKVASWLVASILVYLNLRMIVEQVVGYMRGDETTWYGTFFILLAGASLLAMLMYVVVSPLLPLKAGLKKVNLHPEPMDVPMALPSYQTIAVALDFSKKDDLVLAHALAQGGNKYVLIHVVESAAAKVLQEATSDHETLQDSAQLDYYVRQLRHRGIAVEAKLGFRSRNSEIVRMVKESGAHLLVIGSHGHGIVRDVLYGETVDAVRHQLDIPVLVVKSV